MGGANQPLAHAQFVSNVVDYGMNLQEALESAASPSVARVVCDIVIESRVKPEVREKLTAMGHELEVQGDFSSRMGRGQAVMHDSESGVNFAGSDPRADGSAEPAISWRCCSFSGGANLSTYSSQKLFSTVQAAQFSAPIY